MPSKPRLSDLAEERASEYAPRPKQDRATLVLIGALVAGASVLVFTALIGHSPDDYPSASGITIIIGGAIPGIWHWLKERAHYTAWNKEYENLRLQELRSSDA